MKPTKTKGFTLISALIGLMALTILAIVVLTYAQLAYLRADIDNGDTDMDIWESMERCEIYCPEQSEEGLISWK